MENADQVEESWGWLLLLLGISALLMTLWFVLHPLSALLCTVTGMCTCLSALAMGGPRPSGPKFQTDGGDN
jgi:hypothetical protein